MTEYSPNKNLGISECYLYPSNIFARSLAIGLNASRTAYSPTKTGEYPKIFPNFQNWACCKKSVEGQQTQSPPFGAKICSDICPWALSVPRSRAYFCTKWRLLFNYKYFRSSAMGLNASITLWRISESYSHFQTRACYEKYLKDNERNSFHLARKYARIFVLGY